MEDREVYSFKKNAGETVRISLSEFKGFKLISVRIFVTDRNTGETVPTRKGLTLRRELAGELLEGLRRAVELLEGES